MITDSLARIIITISHDANTKVCLKLFAPSSVEVLTDYMNELVNSVILNIVWRTLGRATWIFEQSEENQEDMVSREI